MIASPLGAASLGIQTATPITSPSSQLSPPLSAFPAEIKSSKQWQAKISRKESQEEAESAKRAKRNMRETGSEKRQFGANGAGAWEIWEEDWYGGHGGEDDDDGVVGRYW
jgi:hypothetical protein